MRTFVFSVVFLFCAIKAFSQYSSESMLYWNDQTYPNYAKLPEYQLSKIPGDEFPFESAFKGDKLNGSLTTLQAPPGPPIAGLPIGNGLIILTLLSSIYWIFNTNQIKKHKNTSNEI